MTIIENYFQFEITPEMKEKCKLINATLRKIPKISLK
jgi:hypothetical protein